MSFYEFKNKHKSDRCFIIGNAPSLAKENLSLLKNEQIFICNKGWEALNIGLPHYNYYVLSDANVGRFNFKNIEEKITSPRFYSSIISNKIPYFQNPYIEFKRIKTKLPKKFPEKFEDGWGKVASVVFDAVIIAHFMGFEKIYLLGVDLDYSYKNTHFYNDDLREVQSKNVMNIDYVLNTAALISCYLKKEKKTLVNLSSNFKHKGYLDVDTLENVI
jgi:hypothetical protein